MTQYYAIAHGGDGFRPEPLASFGPFDTAWEALSFAADSIGRRCREVVQRRPRRVVYEWIHTRPAKRNGIRVTDAEVIRASRLRDGDRWRVTLTGKV